MSVIETNFEQLLNTPAVRIFRSTIARIAGGKYSFNEAQNGAGLILEGVISSDQSTKLPYLRLVLNTIGDMSVARFEAIGNISHYIIDELMLRAFEDYKVMEIELTELGSGRIKIQLNRKKLPSKRLYAVFKKQFFSYYANEPAHLLVLFDQEQDPTTTIAVVTDPRAIRPKVSGFIPKPGSLIEPKRIAPRPLMGTPSPSLTHETPHPKPSFPTSSTLVKKPVVSNTSNFTPDVKSINVGQAQELSPKTFHETSPHPADTKTSPALKPSPPTSISSFPLPKPPHTDYPFKPLPVEKVEKTSLIEPETSKVNTAVNIEQPSNILVNNVGGQKDSNIEPLSASLSSHELNISHSTSETSIGNVGTPEKSFEKPGPSTIEQEIEEGLSKVISTDEVLTKPKLAFVKEETQENVTVSSSLIPVEERILRVIESKPKQKVQSKGLKKDLLALDQLVIKQTLRSLVKKGYLYVDAAWYIRKDPNEVIQLTSSESLDERVKDLSPKEKKVFDILYNREGRKAQARMLMKGTKMSKENLKKILRDLVIKDVLFVQAAWYIIKE